MNIPTSSCWLRRTKGSADRDDRKSEAFDPKIRSGTFVRLFLQLKPEEILMHPKGSRTT